MESNLQHVTQEKSELNDEINAIRLKYEQLNEIGERYKIELEEKSQAIDSLTKEKTNLQIKVADYEKNQTELMETITETKSKLVLRTDEYQDIELKYLAKCNEYDVLTNNFKATEFKLEEYLSEKNSQCVQLDEQKQIIAGLHEAKDKFKIEITEYENQIKELNDEIVKTKKELLVVTVKFNELQEEHQNFIDTNDQKVKKLEGEIQTNLKISENLSIKYEEIVEELKEANNSKALVEKNFEAFSAEKCEQIEKLLNEIYELNEGKLTF